jgi:hypothetical protein
MNAMRCRCRFQVSLWQMLLGLTLCELLCRKILPIPAALDPNIVCLDPIPPYPERVFGRVDALIEAIGPWVLLLVVLKWANYMTSENNLGDTS